MSLIAELRRRNVIQLSQASDGFHGWSESDDGRGDPRFRPMEFTHVTQNVATYLFTVPEDAPSSSAVV